MTENFPKALLVATLLLMFSVSLFAESSIVSEDFGMAKNFDSAYGGWMVKSGRLFQTDTENRLAKINFPATQTGEVRYEFDVRYEAGGVEDMMGGFGVQIFVDKAAAGRSWGNGKSYLLWLNYDPQADYGGQGFRAQVYKSTSAQKMEIMEGYDLPLDAAVLTEANMSYKVPVRIVVDGDTGRVKVYDPTRSNYYYAFVLDEAPGYGNFVSFRTNSLSVSFDNFNVTRIK